MFPIKARGNVTKNEEKKNKTDWTDFRVFLQIFTLNSSSVYGPSMNGINR